MTKDEALKILQLDETATWTQIKTKYRELALQYHPDKVKGKEAEFVELANAYIFLVPLYKDKAAQTKVPKTLEIGSQQENEEFSEIKGFLDLSSSIEEANTFYNKAKEKALAKFKKIDLQNTFVGSIGQFAHLLNNGYSKVKYEGDCIYSNSGVYGKEEDLQPHGYGTRTDGDTIYEGTFFKGRICGLAKITYTKEDRSVLAFFEDDTRKQCVYINNPHERIFQLDDSCYSCITKQSSRNTNNYYRAPKTSMDNLIKNFEAFERNIENDVNEVVEKAQQQTKLAIQKSDDNKIDAKNKYEKAITEATGVGTDKLGYIHDSAETYHYYGNTTINKHGTEIPHGLGVKTYIKKGDYDHEYVGTFKDGDFTGLGYKTYYGDKYYGIFVKGDLHGMGSKIQFHVWYSDNAYTYYYTDFSKYHDNKKNVPIGYAFKTGYPLEGRPITYYSRSYGDDYLLADYIRINIKNDVNTVCESARKIAKLAKTKEENDIEKMKINQNQAILDIEKKKNKVDAQTESKRKYDEFKQNSKGADDKYKTKFNEKIPKVQLHGTFNLGDYKYQGGVDNGKSPYGYGTLTFKNNDVYQGSFKNGEMEFGKLTYNDKSVYQGFFKGGKPHGWGVLTSSDGKTEYYSDSFEGKPPDKNLNEKLTNIFNLLSYTDVSQDSQKVQEVQEVLEYLKTLKGMLFGNDIYLVIEIQRNIKNDVINVVEKATTETKNAEDKRIIDENNAEHLKKKNLENDRLEDERLETIDREQKKILINYLKTYILKPNNDVNVELLPLEHEKNKDVNNHIIVDENSKDSKGKVGQLKDGVNTLKIKPSSETTLEIQAGYMAIVNKNQLIYKGSTTKNIVIDDKKAGNNTIEVEVVVMPFNDEMVKKFQKIVDSGSGDGKSTNDGNDDSGNSTSFSKVALISAATAAATAGLYYAYKKYNKSAKKSSDKRSETKRSETKRSDKRSAKRKKSSETKRSDKRSAKRKRRSA